MATKKNLALSVRRHKLINKMFDLVDADVSKYNQEKFPTTDNMGICGTTFCAAGFLVLAKSKTLFNRLCKETEVIEKHEGEEFAQGDLWDLWAKNASDILGLDGTEPSDSDAGSLFGMSWSWPSKYALRYNNAKNAAGRVAALKARWRYWLAASDEMLGVS